MAISLGVDEFLGYAYISRRRCVDLVDKIKSMRCRELACRRVVSIDEKSVDEMSVDGLSPHLTIIQKQSFKIIELFSDLKIEVADLVSLRIYPDLVSVLYNLLIRRWFPAGK